MKLGKTGSNPNKTLGKFNVSRPAMNQSGKGAIIAIICVVALILICFVISIGRKATATVDVVMLNQSIHKNQVITADMISKYEMIQAEYEKYATESGDGTVKRRIITWEDRNKMIGAFAAYPLQKNTVAMYSSFLKSRTDNSDGVLYSFPGKELVKLDIQSGDLNSFKTYLAPGDKVNVQALYTEKITETSTDMYGNVNRNTDEVFRTETVFNDITLADLLNGNGQSILDLYSDYKALSVTEQAARDNSEAWQKAVQPKTVLVALTPEEKERYYYYEAKGNIEFRVSLPQRSQ